MALLKAFVCQVVLLGLYKLFLEQVVEEHLVPDELTRNCIVGFVCLLCFGIQLYMEKASDEDNSEADEHPEEKFESRGSKSAKKSESAEIYPTRETVGSNASKRRTTTTLPKIETEKMSPNDIQVGDSVARSSAVSSTVAEKVTEVAHSGIFAQFSPNSTYGTIPDVDKAGEILEPKVTVPSGQISYDQEKTSIPVLNGFSETNVHEDSDEDGIEIDQFVAKESHEEDKQLKTVKAEEDVLVKPEYGTVEAEELKTVKEVEVIKNENGTDAVVESECLTANAEVSATKDLDETATPKIDELEVEMKNGIAEESLNCIDKMSLNIIEEIQSKESVQDENEAKVNSCLSPEPDEGSKDNTESPPSEKETNGTSLASTKTVNDVETMDTNGIETSTLVKTMVSVQDKTEAKVSSCLTPEPDERTKDITESPPSEQETNRTSLKASKTVNDETMNFNNIETSTLVKATILSPSEKSTILPKQKMATSRDVCVIPVTIDISFIYACH